MPVLPEETPLFPECSFEDMTLGQTLPEASWWVAHTKPRAEKALARQLVSRSVPFFLPLFAREGRHRNKVLISHLPLFPSYVFLHTNPEERVEALRTNLVVRLIDVADQRRLSDELLSIHRMIKAGVPLAPEDRLQPGMSVEICSGPLKGLEGKIIRRGNHKRLVVEVDFLRRGASMEIDGWLVRPTGVAQPAPAKNVPFRTRPVQYGVGARVHVQRA